MVVVKFGEKARVLGETNVSNAVNILVGGPAPAVCIVISLAVDARINPAALSRSAP